MHVTDAIGVSRYLRFMFWFVACIAECERWKRADNISAENGEFYPLSSVASCMDLCLSKSSCVAIDIWSDTCALHLNASNLESNRVTNWVSQFLLDRSCVVSTVSATSWKTVVTTSTPTSGAVCCPNAFPYIKLFLSQSVLRTTAKVYAMQWKK